MTSHMQSKKTKTTIEVKQQVFDYQAHTSTRGAMFLGPTNKNKHINPAINLIFIQTRMKIRYRSTNYSLHDEPKVEPSRLTVHDGQVFIRPETAFVLYVNVKTFTALRPRYVCLCFVNILAVHVTNAHPVYSPNVLGCTQLALSN